MELERGRLSRGRFEPADGSEAIGLQELIDRRSSEGWRYAGMLRPGDAGVGGGEPGEGDPYLIDEQLEAAVGPVEVLLRWEERETG